MTLEDRVSRLEGALEQIDHRLGDLHQSIIGVREEIHVLRSDTNTEIKGLRDELTTEIKGLRDEVKTEISELRAESNSRFNTLTIMVAGSWVTSFTGIIALFFK